MIPQSQPTGAKWESGLEDTIARESVCSTWGQGSLLRSCCGIAFSGHSPRHHQGAHSFQCRCSQARQFPWEVFHKRGPITEGVNVCLDKRHRILALNSKTLMVVQPFARASSSVEASCQDIRVFFVTGQIVGDISCGWKVRRSMKIQNK